MKGRGSERGEQEQEKSLITVEGGPIRSGRLHGAGPTPLARYSGWHRRTAKGPCPCRLVPSPAQRNFRPNVSGCETSEIATESGFAPVSAGAGFSQEGGRVGRAAGARPDCRRVRAERAPEDHTRPTASRPSAGGPRTCDRRERSERRECGAVAVAVRSAVPDPAIRERSEQQADSQAIESLSAGSGGSP